MDILIDTSSRLKLGLVGFSHKFFKWKSIDDPKCSRLLHKELYDLLKAESLKFDQIDRAFICLGPGSYTGIRLTMAFYQLFEFLKKPVFGFYHFEIPMLLGKRKGTFVCPAHKKELFVLKWDEFACTKSLIPAEDAAGQLPSSFYSFQKFDEKMDIIDTKELLVEHAQELFQGFENRGSRNQPFYFRHEKVEFVMKKKKDLSN